jgi:hypothetical protein
MSFVPNIPPLNSFCFTTRRDQFSKRVTDSVSVNVKSKFNLQLPKQPNPLSESTDTTDGWGLIDLVSGGREFPRTAQRTHLVSSFEQSQKKVLCKHGKTHRYIQEALSA